MRPSASVSVMGEDTDCRQIEPDRVWPPTESTMRDCLLQRDQKEAPGAEGGDIVILCFGG